MRLIPPVAVPFGAGAIASSVLGRSQRPSVAFAAGLAARFEAQQVALFGSGRAALAAVLAAGRQAERDEVLVPAYTCWSVPAAAVRAGCRVRLYDVDPGTFLPDTGAWHDAGGRVAAIVLADLLSASPGRESVIESIDGQLPGSLLVEDCAQSWPARVSSRGVTLLSFGRGKPLPLGHGGALMASDKPLAVTAPPNGGAGLGDAVTLAATVVLGRPGLFRIPASIPMLGIGSTVYDPRFDHRHPFRDWQARLGILLLPEMNELMRQRSRHAERLADIVGARSGWKIAPWSAGPLRLPVYASSRQSRNRVIDVLRGLGVSAGTLYPGTLLEIPALRAHLAGATVGFPGAHEIADRLLTLPVYPTLTERDVERIGRAFIRAVGSIGE